jgi:hypothetical protein
VTALKLTARRSRNGEPRKAAYINRLRGESKATLVVSGADKQSNARAILEDDKEH